jgi:glutamine synthetase
MSAGAGGVPAGGMNVADLRVEVDEGRVDTVVLAVGDIQGRLQGKRFAAGHFLDTVLEAGTEACSYLLATDVEMNTVAGYGLTSWEQGYGDFEMVTDLTTFRPLPWQEATVLCFADVQGADGDAVAPAPRTVLASQLERLGQRGWRANAATELEFIAFRDTYADAWAGGYEGLTPATSYNVDYALTDTSGIEALIGAIRRNMQGAGLAVESSKGECNRGQQEIAFRYGAALQVADEHILYKSGAKEIAAQQGMSLTFMAKYDGAEGNSCHIHLSLTDQDGRPLFGDDQKLFEHFLAGQLGALADFTLLFAPNINSYKRFAPGSFAPTAIAWGRDNRTCALRTVGHGPSLRLENRVPGADVNPYLAIAAMIAAGLDGVERELALEPECAGNAYGADLPRVPSTLREARDRFAASELAANAFGAEIVAHYLNAADVELAAFGESVTDWERRRGFERL